MTKKVMTNRPTGAKPAIQNLLDRHHCAIMASRVPATPEEPPVARPEVFMAAAGENRAKADVMTSVPKGSNQTGFVKMSYGDDGVHGLDQ